MLYEVITCTPQSNELHTGHGNFAPSKKSIQISNFRSPSPNRREEITQGAVK